MGLLEEVTAALERLESSLKAGADMNMHKGKKQNLLLLVSRLKNGLISPDKLEDSPEIEAEEPNFEEVKAEQRMSGHGPPAKRRNRNNRHTVGVSREYCPFLYSPNNLVMGRMKSCHSKLSQ